MLKHSCGFKDPARRHRMNHNPDVIQSRVGQARRVEEGDPGQMKAIDDDL